MRRYAGWMLLGLGLLGVPSIQVESRDLSNGTTRRPKPVQEMVFGDKGLLNINNVSMWIQQNGESAHSPFNDSSGVTYPRFTDQVIYQDGLVWGGRVLDGDPQELRVGGQTYEIGTVPGRITSKGVAESADDPSVRIYRIRRDYRIADLRLDAAEMLNEGLSEVADADVAALRAQYDKDWREWPAAKGAPFYDRDGNGKYEPRFDANGNPDLSGDEPGVAGADQVAWLVLNDLDPGATISLYGSNPIGLEVQVTLWGYARTDALGNAVFKKYTVIYKGRSDTPDNASIKDMYFAQWSDPDLGDAGDDFAGSDAGLNLGYVYNSRSADSHYRVFDLAPPAIGYSFLQGPMVPDQGTEAIFNFQKRKGYRNLPMTAFAYFAAGSAISDPELGAYKGTLEWYNLLRGYLPQPDDNGNPVPFLDFDGNPTSFPLNGTPTIRDQNIQAEPAGEALLEQCGGNPDCVSRIAPFAAIMNPGQTTGSDYTLTFARSSTGELVWNLRRETQLILENQKVRTDSLSSTVDGIAVGLPTTSGMLSWEIPSGERWWTWEGANWGAEGFSGAITGDVSSQWFTTSTVTAGQLRTVEIRFTSVIEAEGEDQYKPLDLNNPNVSYAYRYLRRALDPAPVVADQTTTGAPYDWSKYIVNPSGSYAFQDRSPICLSAWDMDSNPPRRLEVGFLENNVPGGLVNGAYGPAFSGRADNIAAAGPREWLFVFDRDYTADPFGGYSELKGDITLEPMPLMWVVYAARWQEDRFPRDGDSFRMNPLPYPPYRPGDAFTFNVPLTTPPIGWVDGSLLPAGDRRIVLNTGPFEMALGDTQEVVIALSGGLGEDNIDSVERLKANVGQVRGLDPTDWPPFRPLNLTAAVDSGKVQLAWMADADADLSHYIVYQSQTDSFAPAASDSIARVDRSATAYEDTSLRTGTYYFRIAAVDRAGNKSTPSLQAKVTFQPVYIQSLTALSFGAVDLGSTGRQTFTVSNPGTGVLVIERIAVSGVDSAQFGVTPSSFTVKAGAPPETVAVVFRPTAVGDKSAALSIINNASADPATMSLQGRGQSSDDLPPGIAMNPLLPVASLGKPFEVSVGVTDTGGVEAVTLYYREGGEAQFTEVQMVRGEGDTYRAAIPADKVGYRGIGYYVGAKDKVGNEAQLPREGEQQPLASPVRFADFAAGGQYPAGRWRMVGVPVKPDSRSPAELLASLGRYEATRWRLFRFFAGSYHEYLQEPLGDFEPGKAFWLYTKMGGLTLRSGSGETIPIAVPFEITLEPGWNDISVPFAFPVRWEEVMAASGDPAGVAGPYAYDGTQWSSPGPADQLVPWEGYAVKNSTRGPIALELPPLAADRSSRPLARSSAAEGWALQIKARTERNADENNLLGFRKDAHAEWDRWDFPEPPAVPGPYLRLFFPHENWNTYPDLYTSDFRPESAGGIWPFVVEAGQERTEAELAFKGRGDIPDDLEVALVDVDQGVSTELEKNGSYPFAVGGKGSQRRFQIVVGQVEYVENAIRGFQALPQGCELSQNWPNPFNSETVVAYQLPKRSQVYLTIYDLLGRKVKVLAEGMSDPGYFSTSWDGRDKDGIEVASGVYFCVLETGKTREMRKMMLVR